MANVSVKKQLIGKILDVGGGGEGIIGRVYGDAVTAIDLYEEELAEAPDGFEKIVMDARAMTFADESFDAVTAFYSFMFMAKADHARVAEEIFRVLRPGGTLAFWDAKMEDADPFLLDLDIDADGRQMHTTYGVYRQDDAAQDETWFSVLFRQAGFVLEKSCQSDGQIFQRWRRPL